MGTFHYISILEDDPSGDDVVKIYVFIYFNVVLKNVSPDDAVATSIMARGNLAFEGANEGA